MAHAHTDIYWTAPVCRINSANEVEIRIESTRFCMGADEARALAAELLAAASTVENNEPKYEHEEAA